MPNLANGCRSCT